jgi:hypothetical protein
MRKAGTHERCNPGLAGEKLVFRPGGFANAGSELEPRAAERAAELARINRELRAIADCNQTLLRASGEQSLLAEICRIVCERAGYRMAWAGYAENDEAKTVRPAAWAAPKMATSPKPS